MTLCFLIIFKFLCPEAALTAAYCMDIKPNVLDIQWISGIPTYQKERKHNYNETQIKLPILNCMTVSPLVEEVQMENVPLS